MQVFSSFSTIVKLVVICLVLGFVLGSCTAGANWLPSAGSPSPAPAGSAGTRDEAAPR